MPDVLPLAALGSPHLSHPREVLAPHASAAAAPVFRTMHSTIFNRRPPRSVALEQPARACHSARAGRRHPCDAAARNHPPRKLPPVIAAGSERVQQSLPRRCAERRSGSTRDTRGPRQAPARGASGRGGGGEAQLTRRGGGEAASGEQGRSSRAELAALRDWDRPHHLLAHLGPATCPISTG